MAYSDFTALELKRRFGVRFRAEALFSAVPEIQPSAWLQETLRLSQELGFNSEKSRSERLVTPLLLELSRLNSHRFAIYSGMNLDVDELNGLKGECDFIFLLQSNSGLRNGPGLLHHRSQKAGFGTRYRAVHGPIAGCPAAE